MAEEASSEEKRDKKKFVDRILLIFLIVSLICLSIAFFRGPGDHYSGNEYFHSFHDMDNDGDLDIVTYGPEILFNDDGDFSKSKKVDIYEKQYSFTVADFNGDNYPDIVDIQPNGSSVSIYLNDGECNFESKVIFYEKVESHVDLFSTDPVDWNLDGILDLYVTYRLGASDFVLVNSGNGTFTKSAEFKPGLYFYLDYNQDGLEDRIRVTRSKLMVYQKTTEGNFDKINLSLSEPPDFWIEGLHKGVMADMDTDGDLDFRVENLIFVNNSSNFTCVDLEKTELYSFKLDFELYETARIFEDINNDGLIDIIGVPEANNVYKKDMFVYIRFGDANFNFSKPNKYSVGAWPELRLLDVDEDGDSDIVTTNFQSGDITVRYNNGKGYFGDRTDYSVRILRILPRSTPADTFFVDIDHDGDTDIITGNYNGGSVAVLKNDGEGHFDDLEEYIVSFKITNLEGVEDLNGDGYEDIVIFNMQDGDMHILFNDGDGEFKDINFYLRAFGRVLLAITIIGWIVTRMVLLKKYIDERREKKEDRNYKDEG